MAWGKRYGEAGKSRSVFRADGVDGGEARARNRKASEPEFRTINAVLSRRASRFT
jgi:hypothetical protein